jgi:alpha-L-fucosidase
MQRMASTLRLRPEAWFRAAKFGMFIHWGPYSLASVDASWPIMRPGNWGISESDYRALPKRFNPSKWDPDHFIDLASTAGQRYMFSQRNTTMASACLIIPTPTTR